MVLLKKATRRLRSFTFRNTTKNILQIAELLNRRQMQKGCFSKHFYWCNTKKDNAWIDSLQEKTFKGQTIRAIRDS